MTDWTTFNNKVASINGLTGVTQTFAIGTAGNDFNIVSSGNTHTFNFTDASITARGLVSTGSQVFAGVKTFDQAPVFSGFATGSIIFTDSTGKATQDNTNFVWDNTNKRLGLGVNSPKATLHNNGSTIYGALTVANLAAGGTIGTAATTVDIKTTLNINQTTANQTLTLPAPTDTTAGRIIYINSVGTVGFTMMGERIEAGHSRQAMWNGTAWKWVGDQDGDGAVFVTKTADQIINNTTVLQNDTHLTFNIGANETWVFNVDFNGNSPAAQDIKFAMAAPAGATCLYNFYLPTGTVNSRVTTCGTATALLPTSAAEQSFIGYGTITNGATAGTVTLQWAQFVAAAVNTTGRQGSILKAYRIRGADFAEIYYADDHTVAEGDIVSLTGDGVSQVKKSATPYDSKAIGIISTKPGMVL